MRQQHMIRSKAKGKLVAECSIDPGTLVCGDVRVPLVIKDGLGDVVLNALIVFYISERKSTN